MTARNLLDAVDPRGSVLLQVDDLFSNQGMRDVARAFVDAHPRAIDYLAQAPVMALSIDQKTMSHRMRSWFQLRVTGPCERGESLKQIMAEFHMPYPLRRIAAASCEPKMFQVIAALAKMDPAVLGQIIPEATGPQRQWLRNLRDFNARLRQRGRSSETLAWAAVAMAAARPAKGEAADMADFASSPDATFNTAWRWKRATEEMHRWHSRLTVERALRGSPITPETVMDFGKHPDIASVDGFAFVALRTPLSLAEEGAAMRHCVATYINDVMRGKCSIVSIKRAGDRIATLELRGGLINQIKGHCNADVSNETYAAAKAYALSLAPAKPKRAA